MKKAFTLVELLIVISIISILLGLLLPTLAGARESARNLVCQANIRQFLIAMQTYHTENKGDIIGSPGTSGKDILNDNRALTAPALEVRGDASQPFDWAGPMAYGYMGDNLGIPARRDERFALVTGAGILGTGRDGSGSYGVFACPSNNNLSLPHDGAAPQPNGISGTVFQPQLSISYATSREFLWYSGFQTTGFQPRWARDDFWGGDEGGTCWMTTGISNDITLPGGEGGKGYAPRIDRLGTSLSLKVFIVDGTRFQIPTQPFLDHDVSANAGFGGAFSDPGPWDVRFSRASPLGNNAAGQNMADNSFRHGGNKATRGNLGYFDGHVSTALVDDVRRPELFMPTGTRLSPNAVWSEIRDEYETVGGSFGFGGKITID